MNWARSGSELYPQCPQWVQRHTQRHWRAHWEGECWLWLTGGSQRHYQWRLQENIIITIIFFFFFSCFTLFYWYYFVLFLKFLIFFLFSKNFSIFLNIFQCHSTFLCVLFFLFFFLFFKEFLNCFCVFV